MLKETIKLVLPGTPVVKKNTAKTSMFMKNKRTGNLEQRSTPVHYYSPAYNEWAKNALPKAIELKNRLLVQGWELPITDIINFKCLFYFDTNRVVDLSALYEAPQDLLTGKLGVFDSVPKNSYHILMDDSVRFIASHDGSRFLLDYVTPRTEIYLEPFII